MNFSGKAPLRIKDYKRELEVDCRRRDENGHKS
jgi:hypothetical protein